MRRPSGTSLVIILSALLAQQVSIPPARAGQSKQTKALTPGQMQNMLDQYDQGNLWTGRSPQAKANIKPPPAQSQLSPRTGKLPSAAVPPNPKIKLSGSGQSVVAPSLMSQTVPKRALLKALNGQAAGMGMTMPTPTNQSSIFAAASSNSGRTQPPPAKLPAGRQQIDPRMMNQVMSKLSAMKNAGGGGQMNPAMLSQMLQGMGQQQRTGASGASGASAANGSSGTAGRASGTMSASQMNAMMDQYDKPGLWSKTPGAAQASQAAPAQRLQPQAGGMPATGMPAAGAGGNPFAALFGGAQGQAQPAAQAPAAKPANPLQMLFGGGAPAKPTPPPPANPMQAMLRMFLGDGSTEGGDAQQQAQNQERAYNANNYLQTANDQASRAQSASERASYGSDMDARKSAASEAYYAAQAARAAADSATAAAAGGTSEANNAAAQARDAADRAQAAADRAQANAQSSGW